MELGIIWFFNIQLYRISLNIILHKEVNESMNSHKSVRFDLKFVQFAVDHLSALYCDGCMVIYLFGPDESFCYVCKQESGKMD